MATPLEPWVIPLEFCLPTPGNKPLEAARGDATRKDPLGTSEFRLAHMPTATEPFGLGE